MCLFDIFKDVTDLFGADLPVEGGEAGQFVWRDGPLLKALKAGHWIVLDEVFLHVLSYLVYSNTTLMTDKVHQFRALAIVTVLFL